MDTIAPLTAALAGRYDIGREIGHGGMATVYLACDVKHDRNVALKVLHAELGVVLGAERFLTEIRTTANLQHPNILPLFDSGAEAGLVFYVMPYVEGETLRDRIKREGQLSVADAVRIARGVAAALDYAHRRGVIHRDIKPENILLQEGQPLVADFGVALAVSSAGGTRVTQTGISVGTPQYMSPEQAAAERQLDGRSDQYSLASVIYELLAGQPPFTGPSAPMVMSRLMTETPRLITELRPSAPPHVADALATALEKLPSDRFDTAGEFAEALVAERTGAYRTRSAPVVSRSPRWPIAVSAAIAVLAVIAAIVAWRRPAPAPAPVVRAYLDLPAGERLSTVVSGAIALSPQGDRIAYITEGPTGRHAYVRRMSELKPHVIVGSDVRDLTFSPDGNWLAFRDGRELKKVQTDGGSVTRLATAPTMMFVFGMTWATPDMIVLGSNDGLWTLAATGGALERFSTAESSRARTDSSGRMTLRMGFPAVLADGKSIVFSKSQSGRGTRLAVADLGSRKTTDLDVPAASALGMLEGRLLYVSTAGALMAVPFDVSRAQTTGPTQPVADSIFSTAIVGAAASVSASGTLAYRSGFTNELVLTEPAGGVVPVRDAPGVYRTPRFSPDGRKVAIEYSTGSTLNVWVFDRIDKTFTPVTTDSAGGNRPSWSPDGKHVVFTRAFRGELRSVWWRVADGSAPAELLYRPDELINEAVLSPDGKWLLYRTQQEARHRADIFAVPLSGDRKAIPIISSPASEEMPRVSADGKWLAYQSDESGRNEIYVTPFPGPGPRTQLSDQGGTEPIWGRTGKTVYYRTADRIIAVTGAGTDTQFAIAARREVLKGDFTFDPGGSTPNYDISPDGKQFLMLRDYAPDTKTVIVHNWARELRERLAGEKR